MNSRQTDLVLYDCYKQLKTPTMIQLTGLSNPIDINKAFILWVGYLLHAEITSTDWMDVWKSFYQTGLLNNIINFVARETKEK